MAGLGQLFIADYLQSKRAKKTRAYQDKVATTERTRLDKDKELEAATTFRSILESFKDDPVSGVTATEKRAAYSNLPQVQKRMVPLWMELGYPLRMNENTQTMELVFPQSVRTEAEQRELSLKTLRSKKDPKSQQKLGSLLFGAPTVATETEQEKSSRVEAEKGKAYPQLNLDKNEQATIMDFKTKSSEAGETFLDKTVKNQQIEASKATVKLQNAKYDALTAEMNLSKGGLSPDKEDALSKVAAPFFDRMFKLEFQKLKDITLPQDMSRRQEGVVSLVNESISFLRNMDASSKEMNVEQYAKFIIAPSKDLRDQLIDEFQVYLGQNQDIPPRIMDAFNRFWNSEFFPDRVSFTGMILNSPGFEPVWALPPSMELEEALRILEQKSDPTFNEDESSRIDAEAQQCELIWNLGHADVEGFTHTPLETGFFDFKFDKKANERPSFKEQYPITLKILTNPSPQKCTPHYKEWGLI